MSVPAIDHFQNECLDFIVCPLRSRIIRSDRFIGMGRYQWRSGVLRKADRIGSNDEKADNPAKHENRLLTC